MVWKSCLTGRYEVNDEVKNVLREEFFAGYCDDDQTKKTIREIYEKYSYTCDTHTAVALRYMRIIKIKRGI